MNNICAVHGECEHKYHSNGKNRPKILACVLCCREKGKKRRNRKISEYTQARVTILKFKAIHYKGGKCEKCGYNKCLAALEFHHRDPSQKEFMWTKMRSKSWSIIKTEIDKCDLLCANYHRESHWNPKRTIENVNYMKSRNSEFMGERQLQDFSYLNDIINEFLSS